MKIGILTQPLHNNYGGLLQCYALQTILRQMGHEAWVVRRVRAVPFPGVRERCLRVLKDMVKLCIGRSVIKKAGYESKDYAERFTRYFAEKYIRPVTPLVYSTEVLTGMDHKHSFSAYVVGSDQVWRPCYSPCIGNYFLDFVEGRPGLRRVAYAASFGVDGWEYTPRQTEECRRLLQAFDAVSVREASGVDLCRERLGRPDALHVLDPTLLLEREDYERLVREEQEPPRPGNLFCYILDEAVEKQSVIDAAAAATGLQAFRTMPRCPLTRANAARDLEGCVYPPVTAWLRSFMDAEMVVTDSFHGCVFSLIFQKPFWVIGNRSRGLARFHSLLSLFGLEDRMVSSADCLSLDWKRPIDWAAVGRTKHAWQQRSRAFLEASLQQQ